MAWSFWILCGAIAAALGVAFGAFGAHALKTRLDPTDLAIFETAVRYQMYHALALVAVGLMAVKIDAWPLTTAGIAFILGICIFSGSLYTLVLTNTRWLGAVTPIGGLAFIVGWLALAVAAVKPMQGS